MNTGKFWKKIKAKKQGQSVDYKDLLVDEEDYNDLMKDFIYPVYNGNKSEYNFANTRFILLSCVKTHYDPSKQGPDKEKIEKDFEETLTFASAVIKS